MALRGSRQFGAVPAGMACLTPAPAIATAVSEGIICVPGGALCGLAGPRTPTIARMQLPVPAQTSAPESEVSGLIERVIADVPLPRVEAAADPARIADGIAHEAARNAALVSASLALPPGPVGMLTVLPDLFIIWKIQRQLVADIFALHGRTVELTRTHMLYCLFRHMASHVVRDVVVRAGERALVRQLSSQALKSMLGSLGLTVTRRLAGTTASRWVPLAGAAAVGAYAYWDTLQVARTARSVLATTQRTPADEAWPASGPAPGA
jgi:hypothetical protein